jgi:hypothetical protein
LVADRVLLPGVLRTINRWLRGPQKVLLILAAVAVLVPVAVFWVLRRTRKQPLAHDHSKPRDERSDSRG